MSEDEPRGRGSGGAGRGRAAALPPSPAPASGRGRGSTLRKPVSSDEEAASPPPLPASGRGRGTLRKRVSSDDESPSVAASSSSSSSGRGRGSAPLVVEADRSSSSVGRGRGAPVRAPSADSESDEQSPPPSPSPVAAPPSSGRGRGTVAPLPTVVGRGRGAPLTEPEVSTDDELTPRQSPSPRPLSTGRGRGAAPPPSAPSPEEPASAKPVGRGRAASPPPSRDSSISADLPSPRGSVSAGRGRGAAPPPAAPVASSPPASGAGRGATTNISIDLSSDDESWQPPPKKEAPAKDVPSSRVSVKEEPVASGRGRAVPVSPPKSEELPSAGRGRGSSNNSIPVKERPTTTSTVSGVVASAAVDDGEVEPLTALEKRRIERALEAKERTIQTMAELQKDLEPSAEELSKAMQLASYLEREQALEEEDSAPVVQPKAVPFVTKTMSSESTVREAGLPTCLAVRKPWIAIGMTHGVVLVFDANQKLSAILGSQEGQEYGRVCSMSISNSAKMLLVGHGSGAMVLWDIVDSRKPLKVIVDTHRSAVVHIDFLKDDWTWVSGDVDGKLVHSVLTSMLFVYYHSATDIVTGEGEVLALKTLRPGSARHGSDGLGLAAGCTGEGGLIFFSVFPKLRVWKSVSRPDSVSAACIPYLSWREAVNQQSDSVGDPILCVGWGTEILVFRVSVRGSGEVVVAEMGSFSLSSEIVSITWLGTNAIVLLTVANEMKVFDPFSIAVLETSFVENMELCKHNLLGNQYSGCFSNSVTNQGDSGFMLGVKDLYALRIWSWGERVKALIDGKKFLLALGTCFETYQLKGKGYLGISADPEKVKAGAAAKIEEILSAMLTHILLEKEENKESSVHDCRVLASVCIRYCQAIKREQLLFEVIFPLFRKANDGLVFLELLEPFILQDRLTTLNARTLESFVVHYVRLGRLQRVEQCLMHLDAKALDFDLVVRLCREYQMASALIYFYNTGRDDYMTPLDFLFESLGKTSKASASSSSSSLLSPPRAMGLRALLYISLALHGNRFPTGVIPPARQQKVKMDILGYLFSGKLERVKTLIQFDSRETFRCLIGAMEDKSLTAWHGKIADQLQKLVLDPKLKPWKALRDQKIALEFSSLQITGLFVFLARCLSSGAIKLDQPAFELMLSHLLLEDDVSSLADREEALLLVVKSAPTTRYDEAQLHMLSRGAEMHQVSEFFYMKRKDYRKVVQCAIEGKNKRAFEVIGALMANPDLSDAEREVVKKTTMSMLEQLIEIDAEAASMLVMEHFAGAEYNKTVHELDQHPMLQYKLLKGVVNHHVTGEGGERWETIMQDFQLGQELTELYIRLLCEYDPPEVCPYLMKAEGYRHDVCLELVKRYKIEDAVMFLLERTGDLTGAMNSILKALDQKIAEMIKAYGSITKVTEGMDTPEERAVLDMLNVAIGLCQRNSSKEKKDNSQMWFQILDRMVTPSVQQSRAGTRARQTTTARSGTVLPGLNLAAAKTKQTFNFLMREVLRQMMTFVALPAILDKIVRDHARSEFAEFKDVIYNMLDTYHYESSILALANRVLDRDMFDATSALKKRRLKPHATANRFCPSCKLEFGCKPSGLLIYPCGHGFHRSCLTSKIDSCPLCDVSTKKKGKVKGDNEDEEEADKVADMQAKAETATTDDSQARVVQVVQRYESFLSSHSEETPKFKMLQLLEVEDTDVYQFSGAKLTLAPEMTVIRKVGSRREVGALPESAKYSSELTPAEFKSMFPQFAGEGAKKKQGGGGKQKKKN